MGEPVSTFDGPRRRLRLVLDLGADDLDSLAHALHLLANDLEHDGREERMVTSGGYDSGYHLTLACDPDQTGDVYRTQLAAWHSAQTVRGSEQ
jgi:hypothetical protein